MAASEAKKKADAAAKAEQEKNEEIVKNFRPDGLIHKDGVRQFPNGVVVGGVNDY